MWDSLVKNWTTSVPGLLIGICATSELSGILPDGWYVKLMAVCGLLIAFGFLAAKSSNVTNAKDPGPAQTVPPAA